MSRVSKINLIYLHFDFVGKDEKNEEKLENVISLDMTSPCNFARIRRDWMEYIFVNSLAKLPVSNYMFLERRFMFSDPNIFKVYGKRFDKILIAFAKDKIYWNFYMNTKNQQHIEGEGQIPSSYCVCCIEKSYLDIVNAVRDLITKKNSIPTIDEPRSAIRLFRVLEERPFLS